MRKDGRSDPVNKESSYICVKMASMGISISLIHLMKYFSWETLHKTDLRTVRRILFQFVILSPPVYHFLGLSD